MLVVLLAVLVGFVMFHPSKTDAAINPQINFQGKLANPDGTNVTDGTYSIVFSIYTVSSGGSNVWTETQGSVAVAGGIFQVSLGSVTALPGSVDFNSSALYLGVKVGSDAEMTPRIQLTAAPYAFNSTAVGGLTSANLVQLAQGTQADASTTNSSISINKTGGTAAIADFQRGGTSVFTIKNDGSVLSQDQTDSATAFVIQANGAGPVEFTADTTNRKIIIGSATTDTTQVLFQPDSFSTFADTATCAAATNQGAMYYNTSTGAMRACINGNWEDMVSTGGLGLLAFGVVPDSSNAGTVGDIAGVTNYSNSPCKVVWTATQQVTVEPCIAFSGGRKVIVPSTAISTAGLAANAFANICLTAAGNQPALGTGNATETSAALPAFSANNPVLCLATVKASGVAGNVGFIWDTRTFTNTVKQFTSINSVNNNGMLVVGTATLGTVQVPAATGATSIRGVIVATAGTAASNVVNGIIATNGIAAVKFISGGTATINNCVESLVTTAGYGTSAVCTAAVGNYVWGGPLLSTISTSCTTTNTVASACQYSVLVDFRPSR